MCELMVAQMTRVAHLVKGGLAPEMDEQLAVGDHKAEGICLLRNLNDNE